jgi:hypothetical protein
MINYGTLDRTLEGNARRHPAERQLFFCATTSPLALAYEVAGHGCLYGNSARRRRPGAQKTRSMGAPWSRLTL